MGGADDPQQRFLEWKQSLQLLEGKGGRENGMGVRGGRARGIFSACAGMVVCA